MEGNFIATKSDGSAAIANAGNGVAITGGAQSNHVEAGNVISGNSQDGVSIDGQGTGSNTVAGNFIGTNFDASAAVANLSDGVAITGGAQSNTIGGTGSDAGNVISGNKGNGITIDGGTEDANTVQGNYVEGNYIGTNATNSTDIGNTGDGVAIIGWAHDNRIGGSDAGADNVISNNSGNGVLIAGSETSYNKVLGNYIGTNADGSDAVPNQQDGVKISDGAQSNEIGGSEEGAENVISGNALNGVEIDGSDSNTVDGNYIGTNSDQDDLGNGKSGVYIDGGNSNLIGSTDSWSDRNDIWYNGSAGVAVASGQQNTVRMNSIYQNQGIGIDLGDDGVTPNGVQTMGTGGPNNWQYMPVVTTAQAFDSNGNPYEYAAVVLKGVPYSSFTIDLYRTEVSGGYYSGETYVGEVPVQIGANGYASSSVEDDAIVPWIDVTDLVGGTAVSTITATATDSAGNTSEFSLPEMTVTVTNMAPVTMNAVVPSLAQLNPAPKQFDTSSAGTINNPDVIGASLLGGQIQLSGQDGPAYLPNTTYDLNSPWDPYNPYGGGADDSSGGGASFIATYPDSEGRKLTVDVLLVAGQSSGYVFYHKTGSEIPNSANWVDKQATGLGGLLLVGGGNDPPGGYSWFGGQAAGGDIVVIGNKRTAATLQSAVDFYFGLFGGSGYVHAVDGFSFNVDAGDALTADAMAVAQDQAGTGMGREFIDKLMGAEAVYFLGGGQWPYVQLLLNDRRAAAIINQGNNTGRTPVGDVNVNPGKLAVGGTSAGLAILGQYVFTAQSLAAGGDLTSEVALNNPYSEYLVVPGGATPPRPAIDADVLNLKFMNNVITDTHFVQRQRMGRLVTFLAHMSVTFGLAENAKGLGVDVGTALCIDDSGNAQVYGSGSVYFVKPTANNLPAVNADKTLAAPLAFSDLQVNRFDTQSGNFTFTNGWNLRGASYFISASVVDPAGRNWTEDQVWRNDQFIVNKDAYDNPLPPS